MECLHHQGVAAVGVCPQCHSALCRDCLTDRNPPICVDCYVARCDAKVGSAVANLVLMAIVFFIGYYAEDSLKLTTSPVATGMLFAAALCGTRVFFSLFFNTFNIVFAIILGAPMLMVFGVFLAFSIALGYIVAPLLVLFNVLVIIKNRAAIALARR